MGLKVHFIACLTFITTSLSAVAQQQIISITDTTSVPLLQEEATFSNYNFVLKNRLDSIQRTVPLTYNEHVQKYIDIYSSRKDMMGKMLGLSGYYFPIFEKALKSFNIPEEIKYLPIIESSMNPNAVSRVGATGLWQFMFTTARGYGLNMDNFVDERKDPTQASYAAAAYFSDAYAEFGDWLLSIAAYNCGTGNVRRAIEKADSRDFWELRRFLPLETRNYVPAFIAAVYVMNCYDKHEITSQKTGYAQITDTVHVSHFVSIPELAKALDMDEEMLCLMNPSYKKKIVNGTDEKPRRIIVPRVSVVDYAAVYTILNNDVSTNMKVVLASNDDKRVSKKSAKPRYFFHKVSSGQNLSVIANKYHVEVQDLKVWNKLKGSTIVPGQKLKVYGINADGDTSGRIKG